MFEDFSFCTECNYYDRGKRWCKLFNRTMPCGCSYGEDKPKNNFERLKAMSMEELAVVIAWPYIASPPWCAEHTICPCISEDPPPCDKCVLEWLKEEVHDT